MRPELSLFDRAAVTRGICGRGRADAVSLATRFRRGRFLVIAALLGAGVVITVVPAARTGSRHKVLLHVQLTPTSLAIDTLAVQHARVGEVRSAAVPGRLLGLQGRQGR